MNPSNSFKKETTLGIGKTSLIQVSSVNERHSSQVKSPSLKQYVFLREEIRHQDNLINARLSWLVSSQSFLLSGFAITLNGSAHSLLPIYAKLKVAPVTLLPAAGIMTDVASYLTFWAAILRMKRIRLGIRRIVYRSKLMLLRDDWVYPERS